MRRTFVCSIVICLYLCAFSAIPAGYYSPADGKKSSDLLNALHSIIDGHTPINYGSLEPYYKQTDLDANGRIYDMYSTCSFSPDDYGCSQSSVCQCWNKEHSVPSSWFKKATPMYSDLFHVVPTDARVNNFRGNMPYGETSSTAYIAKDSHSLGHIGSSANPISGYSGNVFEPDDEYKGDFARNYFYMVTRYTEANFTQSTGSQVVFTYNGGKAALTDYAVSLFMKWHRQDPVSQKEIDRNNAVYDIQHNRNPFIDYPYLAEYIWGDMQDKRVSMLTDVISSADERFVPGVSDGSYPDDTPTLHPSVSALSFPALLAGQDATLTLPFAGMRLEKDITLSLSGSDASLFSLSAERISAAQANGNHTVDIVYAPLSEGTHTARLTVACGEAEPLLIDLKGVCVKGCNIRWMVNGQTYADGEPDLYIPIGTAPAKLPQAPQSCSDISRQFAGWTATPISGTTDIVPDDLFSSEDDAEPVTGDVTYHAVFALLEETQGSEPTQAEVYFPDIYSDNNHVLHDAVLTNATISFDQAEASTLQRYYESSEGVRMYAGSKLIVRGNNLQKIVFTYGAKDHTNAISVNTGSFSADTWTGLANEVVFTIGGTSKFRAIQQITVTAQEQTSQYTYSRFLTSCSDATGVPQTMQVQQPKCKKVIINGHLYLLTEQHTYNAIGQIVK